MKENEKALTKSGEILPARPDFTSVIEAIRAEERAVEYYKEIPSIVFKLTAPRDWSIQGGRPYLEGHAAARIVRRFYGTIKAIDQDKETLPGGYVRYGFLVRVENEGGGSVELWGYRDTNDDFYCKRHETDSSGRWVKGSDGKWKMKKLPPDEVDTRNVKAAAQTHAMHNATCVWLGIGSPKIEDIAKAWNVSSEEAKKMIGEDLYRKKGRSASKGAPPAGTGKPTAGSAKTPAKAKGEQQKENNKGEGPLSPGAINVLSKSLMESSIGNDDIFKFIKTKFGDEINAFDQIKIKHYNAVKAFIESSETSGSGEPQGEALWNSEEQESVE